MEYIVLVNIPTTYKINASSAEDAKQKITDSLIAQGIVKPADYFKIEVVDEVK